MIEALVCLCGSNKARASLHPLSNPPLPFISPQATKQLSLNSSSFSSSSLPLLFLRPTTTITIAEATTNGTTELGPAVKIDVTEIAKPYREEVRAAIRDKCGGVGPKLVAFLANTVRRSVYVCGGCMCVGGCVRVGASGRYELVCGESSGALPDLSYVPPLLLR
jgi:hypothetical protein